MKKILLTIGSIAIFTFAAFAQTTTFTYQGKLNDQGAVANGQYQMDFKLYDAVSGGTQVGSTITDVAVTVTQGVFTTQLDFGSSPFAAGENRFIEISVRRNSAESYVTLSPRQPITSAPYAIKALLAGTATTADNANQLGGVNAGDYVQTNNPALTDARDPLPGSANYIQNTTTTQASSNFNISGTGKANIIDAATQYNIDGNRILSNAGAFNLFAGVGAGASNTGSQNAFFGRLSGQANTIANSNSFFGTYSGFSTTTGGGNAFVGTYAGYNNGAGQQNTFAGFNSGLTNTTGTLNTLLGANTNVGAAGLTNATAIGANTVVSQSNSLILGNNANVGIGTGAPASKLTVVGRIETTTGGVKFPDGTIQLTAAPGPANVILNQTVQQAGANFNIAGTGIANLFNSATQYNINNTRVLGISGSNNIFVGVGAGINNTGAANAFVGAGAGNSNTTGGGNTFVGSGAGALATTASGNSFFGFQAGLHNDAAEGNSFFGSLAGTNNTGGLSNSFFGTSAGANNLTGTSNSFFGRNAGQNNTTGNANSFFGTGAGVNSTGSNNSYFGTSAGQNSMGTGNSFFGNSAGSNTTGNSNAFFGLGSGTGNITGNSNAFFGAAAGQSSTGSSNSFFGASTGQNTTGDNNAFFGRSVGLSNTTGIGNLFVGSFSGFTNTTGSNNTLVGINTDVGSSGLNFATAIGAGATVGTNNTIVLGRAAGQDKVVVPGLGSAGATSLCRNAANEIATCSSSLRYKKNISPFSSGLDIVTRLRPITFDWKDGGMHDLGLGAEDVAAVNELLVIRNAEGKVEGVKYDRIGVVLLNAVKEQQSEIEVLKQQIVELKKLVGKRAETSHRGRRGGRK